MKISHVPSRLAVATLAAVLPLTACSALGQGDESAGGSVVAAFYPLQYVAERVAGDRFEVTNLTQAGAEPHDLELTVKETAQVSDAALVVHERDFQAAVDAAVDQNATGEVLDVAESVELRPTAGGDRDDPHFWLDPLLMADLGDAVAERLGGIDPGAAESFTDNAAALRDDLESLDAEYAARLGDCARDVVVVNHDAFGYLAKYGLTLEPIVGLSPDAEPTPADLARLQELARDADLTTVFAETLVSRKTAETLADDLGLEVAVLDPIEGLSEETRGEDYASLMRSNLDALARANGCG
ncbi:metal ABC transporter substrate-binding protein [Nocardioides donggukensis]|uniref:Zinc ABC transporter substrate-binding protein n=1 Tax=Nocardioides donggukensis TaxID=2774019 RepID=A0A927K3Y3_9ACTN|nr:metal ABC transporter substrate-binding protein [Nocardioides donggukensis]MBD8869979.1 zinc ABC transporter substrate-binding protein [Nocardioides donggukensis]